MTYLEKCISNWGCIRNDLHDLAMVSDTSKRGFGAWMGVDYFFGVWEGYSVKSVSSDHQEHAPRMDNVKVHEGSINVYELWPVVVGLKRWAAKYMNSKVNIVTDNMQVLAMINTGWSKNRLCMEWLRELFWVCFIHNIELFVTYINTKDNILADHLSRLPYKGVVTKYELALLSANMPSIYSVCPPESPKCPAGVGPRRSGAHGKVGVQIPDEEV